MAQGNHRSPSNPSHWPWINKTLVHSIVEGNFDIHTLPYLRQADSIPMSCTSLVDGLLILLDGSVRLQLKDPDSMFHSELNDIDAFLAAWHVYIMIRGYWIRITLLVSYTGLNKSPNSIIMASHGIRYSVTLFGSSKHTRTLPQRPGSQSTRS